MGTLTDAAILVAGLIAGWFRFRRPLSTAWSRMGKPVATQTSYREVAQAVPIAGASGRVRIALAYLWTLAFFSAARLGWMWPAMQDIYNHGHEGGLVPKDSSGIALQIAIGMQAGLGLVVLPGTVRALAFRRSPRLPVTLGVLALGVLIACVDFAVLHAPDPIYWLAWFLFDDAVYASLMIVGIVALLGVARAERRAPPVVEAAITKESPSQASRHRAFAVASVVLTIVVVASAFINARRRYRWDQVLEGEREAPIDGEPRRSPDGRFVYWLPDERYPRTGFQSTRETPYGEVETTILSYTDSPKTVLFLVYWTRKPEDKRTLAEICPPDFTITSDRSCDLVQNGAHYRRVLDNERVYELRAENAKSAAAQRFLDSFRVLPPN